MNQVPNPNRLAATFNAAMRNYAAQRFFAGMPRVAMIDASQIDQGYQSHAIGLFSAAIMSRWMTIPGSYIGPGDQSNAQGAAMQEYLMGILSQKAAKK